MLDEQQASPDAVNRFEHDAESAGIALPSRRRFNRSNLLIAVVLTVVIIAGALEIGHVTGWINPSRPVQSGPALAGPSDCTATSPPVHLTLGMDANSTTSLPSMLQALIGTFTNVSGSCLSVGTTPAGFGALSSLGVAGLVDPQTPLSGGMIALANQTFTVPLLGSPLVVFYNLGTSRSPLNLTAAALAGAYLGSVTNWSDPQIGDWNPGLHSPLPMTAFYYAGSSAANEILSQYLSQWNSSFRTGVGPSWTGPWPAGSPVSSPEAMLGAVETTKGSLGYEAANVCPTLPKNVTCALVQSGNTTFSGPTVPSILAAVNASANSSGALTGNWANVTGVALENASVYPMVEFTYAVLYHDLGTAYGGVLSLTQATWLLTLLWWVETFEMTGFQADNFGSLVGEFGYVPLPASVAGKGQVMLSEVAYNGTSVLFPHEDSGETGNETGEF